MEARAEEGMSVKSEATSKGRWGFFPTALRLDRPFAGVELIIALILLGLIALLALYPHLRHGGFYLDDWSNAALALQPPGPPDAGKAISGFADFILYRPVLVLYLPLTYFVLGMHMHLHLALAAVLAVMAATAFYGVLRTLGTPWLHAGLISALTILFPWSDATRLWATAGLVTLSTLFMLTGLFLALQGLRRGSWRWHAWAAPLYLLSILTYEATLPMIACLGMLYWLRSGWRAARWRWLADLGAVAAGGVWVATNTIRTTSDLRGTLEHLGQVIEAGGTTLGRSGLPVGPQATTPVLLCLAAILAAGCTAYLTLPGRFASTDGWGLRNWLQLMLGGIAVAALGWAMFVPSATTYYTPTILGETNRINGVSGFGLILVLYGAFGVVGALIGQLRPRARWPAPIVTVLLGGVLAAAYTHTLQRHIELWNLAYAAEAQAIQKTKELVPSPPPGTTIIAGSYPSTQAPRVPILATLWDYDGMVKMEYDDYSLVALPVIVGVDLRCRPKALTVGWVGKILSTAPYGTVRMLNLVTGERASPQSRQDCRRAVGAYVPGPVDLSPSY
ncbi:MAG TPA: hypothetical protein VFI09_03340 [Solirubrobacterales bacterium]|nr:hypothetical protein [Solirubrobacterales bacterium]